MKIKSILARMDAIEKTPNATADGKWLLLRRLLESESETEEAVEHTLAPDVANCHELHSQWMKLYNFCPECGTDVRHAGKA